MNYASIRTCDIANGEGVRVSLFVSGCTHRCKGCFNEEAWDFSYGEPFTRETEDRLLAALAPSHIAGLTILGGEPMEPENQRALVPFLRRVRDRFGLSKTIWIYTGCILESELKSPSRWRTEDTDEILAMTGYDPTETMLRTSSRGGLRFQGFLLYAIALLLLI